jgi:ADP-heptose:LPS heptosyltransferase
MSALRGSNYVLSAYSELFEAHPTVIGISHPDEMPTHTRVIDIRDAIESIEDQDGRQVVLPGKNLRMWEAAGFKRVMDQPRLYLSPGEWTEVCRMKRWFARPCVGVVYRSSRSAKDWAYTLQFIRRLVKSRGCDVFVFGKSLSPATMRLIPPGVHFVLDRPLRDVMQCICMMDVLIGPDTGLMHMGGALGVECLVVCFSLFSDLYDAYDRTTVLQNDNFTMRKGIMGISLRNVMRELERKLASHRLASPLATEEEKPIPKNNCYVRFRGIGDVLLSLPGLATARSLDGDSRMTYVTSPGVSDLVRLSEVVDEVIEIEYEHSTGGRPVLPRGVNWDAYHTVTNAINVVDFTAESADVPRAELFARLMGVDEVDYTTDWKFTVPYNWQEEAERILREAGLPARQKTILLQADSKGVSRNWPAGRQFEFIGLAAKRGFTTIVVSDVYHSKYEPKKVINLTGKLSLQQYVGMIAATSILLCPDSGGLHIAGCTDNLALGLFGSVGPELRIGHYDTVHHIMGKARCAPCNDWQLDNCLGRKHMPVCLWNIRPKMVLDRIQSLLAKGAGDDFQEKGQQPDSVLQGPERGRLSERESAERISIR